MSDYRPTENVVKTTISATLPEGNDVFGNALAGNCDVPTGGAPSVIYECVTATSTPVVKVYVKSDVNGTWRKWRAFQRAVDTDVNTLRTPDTSITLVAGDQIIVPSAGFHSVRLDLQSGTSAVLVGRTSESLTEALAIGAATFKIGDVGMVGVNCYSIVCDTTNENLIDATARRVYGVQAMSLDATPVYVKLYDKATAPSESDTPIWRGMVPANATAANGAATSFLFPMPISLTLGLGVRAVTGITDAGDSALSADEVLVNVFWST